MTERVTDIVLAAAENDAAAPGSDEAKIRALYLTGMDTDGRDAAGLGEVLTAFFAAVDEAQTVDELLTVCMEYDRTYDIGSLFALDYGPDYMDSNRKILYFRETPAFPRRSGRRTTRAIRPRRRPSRRSWPSWPSWKAAAPNRRSRRPSRPPP